MSLYIGGDNKRRDWVAWCYKTGNGRRRTYASDATELAAEVLKSLKILYGIEWAETSHTKDSLHVMMRYHAGHVSFAIPFKRADKKYDPEESIVPEERVQDVRASLREIIMRELNGDR